MNNSWHGHLAREKPSQVGLDAYATKQAPRKVTQTIAGQRNEGLRQLHPQGADLFAVQVFQGRLAIIGECLQLFVAKPTQIT